MVTIDSTMLRNRTAPTVLWIRNLNGLMPPAGSPRLGLLMCPRGNLKREIAEFRRSGIHGVVSMLTPAEEADFGLSGEADAARAAGLKFWSFPIFDHGVPDSPEALTALVDELLLQFRGGMSIGVHCWAGIGRSCLLLSCLLCAGGAVPEEAFARLSRARGFDVPETQEQRRWVEHFAQTYSPALR